jgi:outer membrane protein TolC
MPDEDRRDNCSPSSANGSAGPETGSSSCACARRPNVERKTPHFTGSPALLSLLSNPAAALGTSLALPFVQWREMKLNAKIVRAGYEQAVAAFQQTFYRALGEVESALALRQQLAAQADYLGKALVTARKAEHLAEIQYRAGSVPLKTWLDAQEASRASAAAAAGNRLDRLLAHAALYQVLGGDAAIAATGADPDQASDAAKVSLSEENRRTDVAAQP